MEIRGTALQSLQPQHRVLQEIVEVLVPLGMQEGTVEQLADES